jgi:hypothetical protein
MNELEWTRRLWKLVGERLGERVFVGRERRLWDDTRVDLMTDQWAVEVDWAPKWAEAVGQCQWYALTTYKQPGIVLLVKDFTTEAKHIYRCKVVCTKLEIFLWLLDTARSEVLDHNSERHKLTE